MKFLVIILLSISVIILLSCSQETYYSLSGEILYLQRTVLTEEAVVTIQLVDISKQDVKAKVVTEKVINNPGQVPIKFDIQYNRDDILPTNTYSLNVKIEDKGTLLFIADKTYPVIKNGITDNIKINVVPVDVAVKKETEVNLNTPIEIDAYIDNMQLVPGYWEMGDASSVIEAYYAKDELKLIIEQMDMGDYGSSEYKYYFKDGYLFYHEQNGKRIDLNSKNPGETVDVNVVMLFDEAGNLVGSRKTIDLKPVELHEIEAPGVLKHCELIVQIANQNFNQNL
ncbi:MAG: YbaY family lipoprotein [Ignavibacterium sp.]|nr:MAG: YbaY family lipoprotein [Ignavibacterium sp.]